MTNSHSSRLFARGTTTTLYATSPEQGVNGSRSLFKADDATPVTIDGDRFITTADTDVDKEASE